MTEVLDVIALTVWNFIVMIWSAYSPLGWLGTDDTWSTDWRGNLLFYGGFLLVVVVSTLVRHIRGRDRRSRTGH